MNISVTRDMAESGEESEVEESGDEAFGEAGQEVSGDESQL